MDYSSNYTPYSPSHWDYVNLFLFRPILAIVFVLSLLLLGWFLAWKLVLVHVPLVQEIFGLRKRPSNLNPNSPPSHQILQQFECQRLKMAVSIDGFPTRSNIYRWTGLKNKNIDMKQHFQVDRVEE